MASPTGLAPPFAILDEPCFDVERLRRALRDLTAAAPVVTAARGADVLRSVSLTHRVGAAEPWYDGNNSQFDRATGAKLYEEHDFSIFNHQLDHTYFREVYDSVPFTVGRMRIMVLPPMTVYKMHRDSSRRAHLSIHTNDDARLVTRDGETCHIAPDGRVHIADTRRLHTAYNAGVEQRVHLVMSIVEPSDADG